MRASCIEVCTYVIPNGIFLHVLWPGDGIFVVVLSWHPGVPESRCGMFEATFSSDVRSLPDHPHVRLTLRQVLLSAGGSLILSIMQVLPASGGTTSGRIS